MKQENYAGFDPKTAGSDLWKFMRSSVETTFDNIAVMQDLNVRLYKDMSAQAKAVQEEGLKIADMVFENTKKVTAEYKKAVEEGLKKMEGASSQK